MRVLSQKEAMTAAKRMLIGMGYLTDGGQTSCYFSKRGMMHRKIRVSDHPHSKFTRLDVLTSIEFVTPTILPDVEYRVMRAHRMFEEVRTRSQTVSLTA